MSTYKMLDGNGAAVEAICAAKPKVIAAYPITPQSSISEKLSEKVASGKLDARFVRVESEHSAMSVVLGAELSGVRAATATSSVGLALMHEIVNAVSGVRLPVVMPIVNRSIGSPWSLWCDHQDSMAERDSGWLQFYCENVQDVYDLLLCAYKIAENEKVLTPAMVCLDGFFLSHSMQKIAIEDQALTDAFLGSFERKNSFVDPANPMVVNNLTPTSDYMEVKYQQMIGFENAGPVIEDVFKQFADTFGRKHSSSESYRTEDAEVALVTLGSMSGTVKCVVDALREKGIKAGAVKITTYRPFPKEMFREQTKHLKKIAVIDRTANLGTKYGPLYADVFCSVGDTVPVICDYVAGLGGGDISMKIISDVFQDVASREQSGFGKWMNVRENALELREVLC